MGQDKLKKAIAGLFDDVKSRYPYIFGPTAQLELNDQVLAYVVSELQRYSLTQTRADVKGVAYEQLVGSNLRGDRGEFKRVYSTSEENGWPYLSPSETFQFRPTSERWIARRYAPAAAGRHFAKAGWILVSASGTVGRPVLVSTRLERFFLSHDLVRIVPSGRIPAGYLYAYLASWVGQALLTKDQYGSAIKHLEAHHVASVPVPLLPIPQMEQIAATVREAQTLREEANQLLDEATEDLYKELSLPEGPSSAPDVLPGQAFIPHSSELQGRFDASLSRPNSHRDRGRAEVWEISTCGFECCVREDFLPR